MPEMLKIAPALAALGLIGAPAATPAQASPPAQTARDEGMVPDGRLGTRVAPLLLLGRPDVRADLGMSAEQSASARRQIADLYRRAMATQGLAGAEAVAARRAIDDSQRAWIDHELTAEQQARLAQLDLQWEGPAALVTRGAIAESLGLRPEQREALTRAVDRRIRRGHPPGDEPGLARDALEVLTPEQRDRWLALLGAPLFGPRAAEANRAALRK